MRLFAPFLPNRPSNLSNWEKEKMLKDGGRDRGHFWPAAQALWFECSSVIGSMLRG